MPYHIPNETPEDIEWMERCISAMQKKDPSRSKEDCIAICKAKRIQMKELEKMERKRGGK